VSRNSSVGTVTALLDGRPAVRIQVMERDFLSPETSQQILGPTQPPTQWMSGFFLRVKRSWCEVNHSPPCSAEGQNEWSYTSTPHTPLWRGKGKIFIYFRWLYFQNFHLPSFNSIYKFFIYLSLIILTDFSFIFVNSIFIFFIYISLILFTIFSFTFR
jgi:hypothetical protein